MPRLNRTRKRRVDANLTERQAKILLTGSDHFNEFGPRDAPETDDAMRAAWECLRDELLPRWIEDNPGTRPWAWWEFDAPERRQCVNGIHPFDDPDRQAIIDEVESEHPEYRYAERVTRLHWGRPNAMLGGSPRDWEAIYETDRAYLDRLDLLTADERIPLADVPEDDDEGLGERNYRVSLAGVRPKPAT